MLTVAPLIPLSVWLTLAVAAAALLVWYAATARGGITRGRWRGIVAAMAVTIALPLLLLLNLQWVEPIPPPPGKPLVTILIDASAGMATDDGAAFAAAASKKSEDPTTRFAAARKAALALRDALGKEVDVEFRLFSDQAKVVDAAGLEIAPAGEATDLAAAIESSLVADRPAGQSLVLLSDGIHNADIGATRIIEAATQARAAAVPIFTRTFGGDAQIMDLDVRFRSPQELAFVGREVPVVVQIMSRNATSRTADVKLYRDDKLVEEQQVSLVDGLNELSFKVGDAKPGLYRYTAHVAGISNEVSTANNLAPLVLRVIDQPIQVLLLEGKPYWDTKFLVRTLMSDAAVELTSVIRMTNERLLERTLSSTAVSGTASSAGERGAVRPPVPEPVAAQPTEAAKPNEPTVRREDWRVAADPNSWLRDGAALEKYQVIVLGRDSDIFLGGEAPAALRNWIDRDGGSLVCFRGAPTVQAHQQLAAILPLRWVPARESRFHVQLTDYGRDMQWFPFDAAAGEGTLERMPTLAAAAQPDRLKPAARVVAAAVAAQGAEGNAVVTYQPFGLGQVVVVEGAGMWRWAFLPPAQQTSDQVYGELWRGMLRHLISGTGLLPNQDLALRNERVLFGAQDVASAMLLSRKPLAESGFADGKPPEVELIGPTPASKPARFVPVPLEEDPNGFRVSFGKLPEGTYQAQVVGRDDLRTAFDVRRELREQLDVRARPDLMARIADVSGGAVLEAAPGESGADDVRRKLAEHQERTRPREVRRRTAWDRWWILVGITSVWSLSWARRRSAGRV